MRGPGPLDHASPGSGGNEVLAGRRAGHGYVVPSPAVPGRGTTLRVGRHLNPSAGTNRIRFSGLAPFGTSQSRSLGHPVETRRR